MTDGFSLVCPACGQAADLSAGLRPNEDGRLLCAGCGAEIPIPLAAPAESLGDTTTTAAAGDIPTVVDAQHMVHPAGDGSVESDLRDCGAGRYAERETIGKGGMGEIVLCVEHNTRREVAMKRMLPTAAGHAKQLARFVEEAQVTAQLEHPNIVPVHELGRDEQGAIYFTMKLVKGRSLAEILAAARDGEETHSLSELLGIFLKVCDGVAFAHSRGVVHRDLKPANIMVGDFGEVLVMDWGIARILGRDEDEDTVQSNRQDTNSPALHTIVGAAMGSPSYMPPEQALGQHDKIDHRSDIYSLGAILYNILTLKLPVEGQTARVIMDKVVAGDIHPPERRTPDRNVPRELSAVAMKCLAKYRGKRYASVPDLQRDISLYLEGRSVSAAPDTFAQALVKLVKRNRGISVAVAAAGVILTAVVSVAFIRVTGAMQRAISGEQRAVTERQVAQDARDKQRATALAASESLAGQAIRAAEQGRFAEADVRADTATEIMPAGPWGPYAMGVVAFEKRDFTTARKHLDEAIRLDPSHNPSKVFLSRVLTVAGDVTRADTLVDGAEANDDWRSLVAAGDALADARRYVRAVKAYEKSAELMKTDATTPPVRHSEIKDKLSRAKDCLEFESLRASIQSLPATEQTQKLEVKLKEIYGSDMSVGFTIEKGTITGISLGGQAVRWLDPFRGMYLTSFKCSKTSVGDLGPLRGMPLTFLDCSHTRISDLRPLKGMPLVSLNFSGTRVTDLTPLKGMKLTELNLYRCGALTSLKGIEGMKLTSMSLYHCSSLASLKGIEGMKLTGRLDMYNCSGLTNLNALKGMKLTGLTMEGCASLRSLQGIEGMPLINGLSLEGCRSLRGDLSVLEGMKLTNLDLRGCSLLTSLRGIEGMPLTSLQCSGTAISDLTPLKGMKLTSLNLDRCHSLSSLKGLEGAPLVTLTLQECSELTSLRGIEGMPLASLNLSGCSLLTSLKGIEGMVLTELNIVDAGVSDLSALRGMMLEKFHFTPKNITKGIEIIRNMKSIRQIGIRWDHRLKPEEFWKKYDAEKASDQ
ncbi:MAG: protein kinase [Phycisphaerae bacterium]|nr:protein kinase [Phycisphaerae bacterium]